MVALSRQKLEGKYYTPSSVAAEIVKYISSKKRFSKILEPSCGDGSFLQGLLTEFPTARVTGVDKDIRAIRRTQNDYAKSSKIKVVHSDFVRFAVASDEKFDLVVGNPPFVRKSFLGKRYDSVIKKSQKLGKGYSNLWELFVILSCEMVTPNGAICFVLPTELLQVKYAESVRKVLMEEFRTIEVISFDLPLFPDIQQDVVLLYAEKGEGTSGVTFKNFESIKDLNANNLKNSFLIRDTQVGLKWSGLKLLGPYYSEVCKLSSSLSKVSDLCRSRPGLVSGANSFFLKKDLDVKSLKLSRYARPILSSSQNIASLVVNTEDIDSSVLDFNEISLDANARKYISNGLLNRINQSYKCRIRKNWYQVPIVPPSNVVYFKRSHLIPKLVHNASMALCTDSAYCLDLNEGIDYKSFILSFYNSLTLVFSEITGRQYGGGVLELTPAEFKRLPIPYTVFPRGTFEKLKSKLSNDHELDSFIKEMDREILVKRMGISEDLVCLLQKMRGELVRGRLGAS